MSAYAVAHLRKVDLGAEVLDYMERIDATLTEFEGRFLVHGNSPEVVEDPWEGQLVIIEFPDIERARAWYRSPAYQEILPLRTANSDSSALIVEGVPAGYRAADLAARIRATASR